MFLQILLILAVTAFGLLVARSIRRNPLVALGNVGEGFLAARRPYYVDAVVGTRYLLAKLGSDSRHVDICGAADIPLGIFTDEAASVEDLVTVQLFGGTDKGQMAIASAAISAGDLIVAAASGKVKTLPASTGTYYIVGRALEAAAADGDKVQFIPCFPTQRVVA